MRLTSLQNKLIAEQIFGLEHYQFILKRVMLQFSLF